jgi:hypothetical protein
MPRPRLWRALAALLVLGGSSLRRAQGAEVVVAVPELGEGGGVAGDGAAAAEAAWALDAMACVLRTQRHRVARSFAPLQGWAGDDLVQDAASASAAACRMAGEYAAQTRDCAAEAEVPRAFSAESGRNWRSTALSDCRLDAHLLRARPPTLQGVSPFEAALGTQLGAIPAFAAALLQNFTAHAVHLWADHVLWVVEGRAGASALERVASAIATSQMAEDLSPAAMVRAFRGTIARIASRNRPRGLLMPGDEAVVFARAWNLPAGGLWVEVGSHRGLSAVLVQSALRATGNWAARVVAVDLWEDFPPVARRDFFDGPLLAARGGEHPRAEFEANVREDGMGWVLRAVQGHSAAMASAALCSGCADVVFIDGDHSGEGSYADMVSYWRVLDRTAPDSVMFGHDAVPLGAEHGEARVRSALVRFAHAHGLLPVVLGDLEGCVQSLCDDRALRLGARCCANVPSKEELVASDQVLSMCSGMSAPFFIWEVADPRHVEVGRTDDGAEFVLQWPPSSPRGTPADTHLRVATAAPNASGAPRGRMPFHYDVLLRSLAAPGGDATLSTPCSDALRATALRVTSETAWEDQMTRPARLEAMSNHVFVQPCQVPGDAGPLQRAMWTEYVRRLLRTGFAGLDVGPSLLNRTRDGGITADVANRAYNEIITRDAAAVSMLPLGRAASFHVYCRSQLLRSAIAPHNVLEYAATPPSQWPCLAAEDFITRSLQMGHSV